MISPRRWYYKCNLAYPTSSLIVSPQSFTPFPHGSPHTCIPYILLTPFSHLDWWAPHFTAITPPLCTRCRRWVGPAGDRSYSVKTGAILRDVTMHRGTTMRVKEWKGRCSDHSCSESDKHVYVLSICLATCLPKPALTFCKKIWRHFEYPDIVSSANPAMITVMGFQRFIFYVTKLVNRNWLIKTN